METCGGAHHWGRLLRGQGHEVKLIPAQFVRPYVKSNKTDASDAEAICEAVQRPGMRFAAVKELDVQALHRTRRLLVKQRIAAKSVNRVAMASRNARIAWAMVRRDALYQRGMTAAPAA